MYFESCNPNWSYERDSLGNITKVTNSSRDGHGGHAQEHWEQMAEISQSVSEKVLSEKISEIRAAAYAQAQGDFMRALTCDIESIVAVSIDKAGDIFYNRKTQKAIAAALTEEIKKKMDANIRWH